MKRTGAGLLVVLGLAGMLGAGWFGLRPYLFRETIKIVSIFPEADPDAEAAEAGLLLALEEAEHRAGRFRVVLEAQPYRGKVFLSRVASISSCLPLDEDVMAVFGTGDAETARAVAPRCNQFQIVMTSPYFNDGTLTRPGDGHLGHPAGVRPGGTINYFCMFAPGDVVVRKAGHWARRRGLRTAMVVFDDTLHGLEYYFLGGNPLRDTGLDVVGNPYSWHSHRSRTNWAKGAVEQNPDLVYCGLGSAAYLGDLVRILREAGFRGEILCAGPARSPEFLAAAGKHAEGVHVASGIMPFEPGFEEQFRSRFREAPRLSAYGGYLAGRYLLEAFTLADRKDRSAILEAFSTLAFFDKNGEPAVSVVSLYVVKNGKFEFVEELKE